ncbi:hypothetical protein FRB90_006893, partial [Tulasnella sp. 427]
KGNLVSPAVDLGYQWELANPAQGQLASSFDESSANEQRYRQILAEPCEALFLDQRWSIRLDVGSASGGMPGQPSRRRSRALLPEVRLDDAWPGFGAL